MDDISETDYGLDESSEAEPDENGDDLMIRITNTKSINKQVKHQSTMAKPDAQTLAKKPQDKGKKSPDSETT
ncbi:hypothetical protein C1646_766697 [Rhizophagus diaphanus]|nr:hypothetical protein C1646_766697 [Rhizophagus diaphanus] [Rhizophagus sp. MUCL 43196]